MPEWSKDWNLSVNYELDNGSIFPTTYLLYNSPYMPLWINQWRQYKARSKDSLYSWFINKTKEDLPEIYKRLFTLLDILRKEDVKEIPYLEPGFNQQQFNEWHKIFEDRAHCVPLELNKVYMELNAIIHTVESIQHSSNHRIHFRSVIGVLGLEEALPLEKEYQLFSHHAEEWGDLIMSYATTGKNWAEVVNTNDLELVKNNGVTNKTLIRQEFVTYFHSDGYIPQSHLRQLDQLKRTYDWYLTVPDELKSNVPIKDLNELFFRNLYLGYIDLKKLPNIDYDSYIDSMSYRIKYQRNFNLNYFNKVKKVLSIEFNNLKNSEQSFTLNNYE